MRKKITLLFHYFHPDDVAGAPQFSMLAENLATAGWDVEAIPCNRSSRRPHETYPARQKWNGVLINRIWRPALSAVGTIHRIIAAIWMMCGWLRIAFRRRNNLPDVIVVGSEPILGVAAAWLTKLIRPSIKLAYWSFDLYPEILSAGGRIGESSIAMRLMRAVVGAAYRKCDAICDSGPCMRRRLEKYPSPAERATFLPWAICQPQSAMEANPDVRAKLFGDAKFVMLYSGNFGLAHKCEDLLKLAAMLRPDGGQAFFSVRGHKVAELTRQARQSGAEMIPFAEESSLIEHLSAADVHLASLCDTWSGLVVPSKFFGSLAVGRPVVYSGPSDSTIAILIGQHKVGWVLTSDNITAVANELRELSRDAEKLRRLQTYCREIYQKHFSRQIIIDEWVNFLNKLAAK